MHIIKLNQIDSTHIILKEYILKNGYKNPVCFVTDFQTQGIGSRGNSWIGKKGNLFFSFVIHTSMLPKDLPFESISIYFTYIFKNVLKEFGSKVWIKWPNDFYVNEKKIGGAITSLSKDLVYCGIGLNLLSIDNEYDNLDIKIDADEVLGKYFEEIKKAPLWKLIFSQFKIEFGKSKKLQATVDNEKVSLENATLNDDGSIKINNKKVFSLR